MKDSYKYIFLINLIFLPLFLFSQDDQPISDSDKKVAIKKIIKKLKKSGYAYNQTFQDIDQRIKANQSNIDTTSTIETFVLTVNTVFESYGLSHLWVWTPEDMNSRISNSTVDIGASLTSTEKGYFVSRVTEAGVADKGGIRPGDYLTQKYGKDLISRNQLRGIEGEKANISLLRGNERMQINIEYFAHRPFSRSSVYSPDNKTAIITVPTFRFNVYNRDRIESLFDEARSAERIIIDLRSNGGGFSGNVQHLLSMIIPSSTVCQYFVHREDHDKFYRKHNRSPNSLNELTDFAGRTFTPLKVKDPSKVYNGEVIVLIDERSGSAGEVFPSCVQDIERGIVVGNVSVGKVLSGDDYALVLGMTLFYPTGESLRLNGERLEGNGCIPDIKMTREETANTEHVLDYLSSYDIQSN